MRASTKQAAERGDDLDGRRVGEPQLELAASYGAVEWFAQKMAQKTLYPA